jgi:hypothetical protein
MSKYVRDRLRPVEDSSVSVEVAGIHELAGPQYPKNDSDTGNSPDCMHGCLTPQITQQRVPLFAHRTHLSHFETQLNSPRLAELRGRIPGVEIGTRTPRRPETSAGAAPRPSGPSR